MRISDVQVRLFFSAILPCCFIFAGYPGIEGAAKAWAAGPQQPESLRQLGASEVSLKFFATDTAKGAPMANRAYTTDFIKGNTHYIWWELQLNAKAKRDKPVRLFIKAV
jgi:hypothetical protein